MDARQYNLGQNIKELFSKPLNWSPDETWPGFSVCWRALLNPERLMCVAKLCPTGTLEILQTVNGRNKTLALTILPGQTHRWFQCLMLFREIVSLKLSTPDS